MNYIQQTWKIEDDVAEWRETFKILNTEKDFFLLVILFILSQNWTRFDRVRESNCIFNIFSVNPLLSHPPLSFKFPLPSAFPLLIDGIIGYFDCGWNPKACTFPGGGYSRKFWIGVCREGSWSLTLFRTKKAKTDTLFKAQSRKMTPYSRKKQNY